MRTDVEDQNRVAGYPGHPLDNPVWAALTSSHAGLAEGGDLARRYPAAFAPFAAMCNVTDAAFAALRTLLPRDTQLALFLPKPLEPASGLTLVGARQILQMTAADVHFSVEGVGGLVELGAADVHDMVELTELTHPGPFALRTRELGRYLGVRTGGKLVAMAGERMRFDGHTEISAVCVHPNFRGRGHAQQLVSTLAGAATRSGMFPFLHVFTDNAPAIAMYYRLGFVVRRTMHVTRLRNAKA